MQLSDVLDFFKKIKSILLVLEAGNFWHFFTIRIFKKSIISSIYIKNHSVLKIIILINDFQLRANFFVGIDKSISFMNNNKISIITVTHNASKNLQGLIDSLKVQTDPEFEWIVADGGSNDGTVELLNSIQDLDIKISVQKDFGIYDAMNRALKIASSDYYLVLGADDRLYPDAVSQYKSVCAYEQPDIVTAKVNTSIGQLSPCIGNPSIRGHLAYVSQHSVGSLIKKSLHNKFGFYSRRFPIAADHFFLKKACKDRSTIIKKVDFIAGFYPTTGVSGTDILGSMTEFFRVQVETEKNVLFQIVIFILRLIIHMPKIIKSVSK